MAFRELSAWITLTTVLLCFGVYFGALALGAVAMPSHGAAHLFLACVLGLMALQVVLHALAARLAPDSAGTPRDERERLIQTRAHAIGYYVLSAAVLGLAIPGHMPFSNIELLNFALLGLVAATLATSIAQIVMFRRGA